MSADHPARDRALVSPDALPIYSGVDYRIGIS